MANPLHQFKITSLYDIIIGGHNFSFTNSSLYMLLAIIGCCFILWIGVNTPSVIPTKMQVFVEMIYEFIEGTLDNTVGNNGKKFLPLFLSLFLFILFCNLFGMLPYGFTVTSQIIVTFVLAIIVFITITLVGLIKHGTHFFSLFLPRGIPVWLAPLIMVIELFTYCFRPISLSLRLAANMMAGHILIEVLATFVVIGTMYIKPLPIPLIIILIGFEIFVAILQAYIFTILSCVYLNDTLNLH